MGFVTIKLNQQTFRQRYIFVTNDYIVVIYLQDFEKHLNTYN